MQTHFIVQTIEECFNPLSSILLFITKVFDTNAFHYIIIPTVCRPQFSQLFMFEREASGNRLSCKEITNRVMLSNMVPRRPKSRSSLSPEKVLRTVFISLAPLITLVPISKLILGSSELLFLI